MIDGSDVVFGSVRSTGHTIALRETDRLTILLPRQGRLRVRIAAADHVVTPTSPMAFRPGDRTTEAIAGHLGLFAATAIQVPVSGISRLAEAAQLPLRSALGPDGLALRGRLDPAVLHAMKRLADDIFLQPDAALPSRVAAAAAAIVNDQLMAMLDSLGEPALPRVLPAFHRVRAAEEIMRAHSEAPLSMAELAKTLGVSLRSLQLAFREVHDGKSPREVYSRIRLDRARQRLLAASSGEQVTGIALDSGFLHLSRFAMTYARTFGERPSETLARRRRA
jgi:AraC-like DNA-binding protein